MNFSLKKFRKKNHSKNKSLSQIRNNSTFSSKKKIEMKFFLRFQNFFKFDKKSDS